MKTTDIPTLFLVGPEIAEKSNPGTEVPVTGGTSKGRQCAIAKVNDKVIFLCFIS